jgi:hypothetical protein
MMKCRIASGLALCGLLAMTVSLIHRNRALLREPERTRASTHEGVATGQAALWPDFLHQWLDA